MEFKLFFILRKNNNNLSPTRAEIQATALMLNDIIEF
jgi:hypothetical protein